MRFSWTAWRKTADSQIVGQVGPFPESGTEDKSSGHLKGLRERPRNRVPSFEANVGQVGTAGRAVDGRREPRPLPCTPASSLPGFAGRRRAERRINSLTGFGGNSRTGFRRPSGGRKRSDEQRSRFSQTNSDLHFRGNRQINSDCCFRRNGRPAADKQRSVFSRESIRVNVFARPDRPRAHARDLR